MNDTEILDRVVNILNEGKWIDKESFHLDFQSNGGLELVKWIERERAEEALNEKIRIEVKRQIKKRR